jgi:hypothetical protein
MPGWNENELNSIRREREKGAEPEIGEFMHREQWK